MRWPIPCPVLKTLSWAKLDIERKNRVAIERYVGFLLSVGRLMKNY
jgi:hypothetical protein